MITFIVGIIVGVLLFLTITGLVTWGYKQGLEEQEKKRKDKLAKKEYDLRKKKDSV